MTNEPPAEVQTLIDRLKLQPHPEGGWFRETFRSAVTLPLAALPAGYRDAEHGGSDARTAMTSILFLLPAGVHTTWHRAQSEELWLYQLGDSVQLEMTAGDPERKISVITSITLGGDVLRSRDAQLQSVVPRQWWQRARALPGPNGYALVACVVAPGFEFVDFEVRGEHSERSMLPDDQ